MVGCKDINIFSYSSSSVLRVITKKHNKTLANIIENNFLNRKFGLLLFAIGIKY